MLKQDNRNTRSTRTFDSVNTHLLTEALLYGWRWHGLLQNESLCRLIIPSYRSSWALSTSRREEETKELFHITLKTWNLSGTLCECKWTAPLPSHIRVDMSVCFDVSCCDLTPLACQRWVHKCWQEIPTSCGAVNFISIAANPRIESFL
jgi:hypothetical protein